MAAAQSACTGRARLKSEGDRARAERTFNMPCMFVTLEVSKLSCWLNAFACCEVERRACNVGRGALGVAWRRRKRHVHGRGPTQGWGGQGTRGAHAEHVAHVRDLRRVEAERLVELVHVGVQPRLPSRKAGMRCGERCGTGGVRALGGGDASGMNGEGSTQGWGAAERT